MVLVLSKETGIGLYVLAAFFYVLVVRRKLPTVREALFGFAPVLVFAATRLWQQKTAQGAWADPQRGGILKLALEFSLDRHVLAYLFVMFAFQFQWIQGLLAFGAAKRLRDRRFQYLLALLVSVV